MIRQFRISSYVTSTTRQIYVLLPNQVGTDQLRCSLSFMEIIIFKSKSKRQVKDILEQDNVFASLIWWINSTCEMVNTVNVNISLVQVPTAMDASGLTKMRKIVQPKQQPHKGWFDSENSRHFMFSDIKAQSARAVLSLLLLFLQSRSCMSVNVNVRELKWCLTLSMICRLSPRIFFLDFAGVARPDQGLIRMCRSNVSRTFRVWIYFLSNTSELTPLLAWLD